MCGTASRLIVCTSQASILLHQKQLTYWIVITGHAGCHCHRRLTLHIHITHWIRMYVSMWQIPSRMAVIN